MGDFFFAFWGLFFSFGVTDGGGSLIFSKLIPARHSLLVSIFPLLDLAHFQHDSLSFKL